MTKGQRLFFGCGGVDYSFLVKLNGQELYRWEGMFTPFELDLTERVQSGDLLEIVIRPVPKSPYGKAGTANEANQSCKLAVSYGWDFHPKLIPMFHGNKLVF